MANYILLERIELNASAASVDFTNIPQSGYTDLKLVISARVDASGGASSFNINVALNGFSTNRTWRLLEGYDGTNVWSNNNTTARLAVVGGSTTTANTFNNAEIYIPNYAGSTNKSISSDFVSEQNSATVNSLGFYAGLWSQTAAINQLTLTSTSGNFVQYSTFSLYGLAAVGTTPAIAPKASGGNIDYDGTYWIHTFLTSGTFTPQTGLTCDALVVAGGGGGGGSGTGNVSGGGGGGAGGFRTGTSLSVTATSYTITVGAGGNGSTGIASLGTQGSSSEFSSITSAGGGGGGTDTQFPGGSGGSGGGGYSATTGGGGISTPVTSPVQGFRGGSTTTGGGPGGGGSSEAGVDNTGTAGTRGGNGTSNSYSGSAVTYAGGGGGGGYQTATGGAGGTGGGGAGASSVGNGSNASPVNLGGGGGGARGYLGGSNVTGGNGSSGIVIIRYLAA